MAVFTVHAPPGDPATAEVADRVVFVREGFSFFAFLLPWLYFLLHRVWFGVVLYLLALAAVGGGLWALGVGAGWRLLGLLLLSFYAGLEAPGFRQWTLRRRGLPQIGAVVADKREDAEMRFFGGLPRTVPSEPRP